MATQLKARENLWALMDMDGKVIRTVIQPDEPDNDDETGWTTWVPVYNERRVHGDRYEYYNGTSDWVRAANAAMASKANYNFRVQSGV